uniref:Uncharacterized protein n=1 Tax=Fagus sylvatica TaxID=28930 RepID=A0A2N9IMA7_FAGSY
MQLFQPTIPSKLSHIELKRPWLGVGKNPWISTRPTNPADLLTRPPAPSTPHLTAQPPRLTSRPLASPSSPQPPHLTASRPRPHGLTASRLDLTASRPRPHGLTPSTSSVLTSHLTASRVTASTSSDLFHRVVRVYSSKDLVGSNEFLPDLVRSRQI